MSVLALPFPPIDPVAFSAGPIVIRWYALAYIAGLLIGWLYARWLVSRASLWNGPSPLTPAHLDDFLLYAALGVILGGRLGYVLVYNPSYFLANPAEIPIIWGGGMSFHGGFLGVVVACVIYGWAKKIHWITILDVLAAVTPIGLFLGRIANFINGELWGRITDVPWAVIFPTGGPFGRHPSQLYQAGFEGILLFAVITWAVFRFGFRQRGLISGVFALGYGLARIVGEVFREPDPQIGFLAGGSTMGMLLSVPMVLIGIWLIVQARRNGPDNRQPATP
jgi:phosphatidylglycerol:prolipoprotein diacylglycerol transferase